MLFLTFVNFVGCSCSESESNTVPVVTTIEIPETTIYEPEPVITTVPPLETETIPPQLSIPPGSHACRFTSENTGDYLDYYLFIPQNAVPGMPMIVFLHGDGEVGKMDSLESYGLIQALRDHYGDEFPCIVISPCTRQPSWIDGTIPDTLMDLIGFVTSECEADAERIIITGHSRGAIGVWHMISEYGDFFSAAVPVSCGAYGTLNYGNVCKVPVYALAGDVGQYEIIYKRDMENIISNIQSNGGFALFDCLEGCSHIDMVTAAYSETVIKWMME